MSIPSRLSSYLEKRGVHCAHERLPRLSHVQPRQTSEECMALLTESLLRHLAVMEGSTLIGVISIGDLVMYIISEQKFVIVQLEHYISGQRGSAADGRS